MTAPNLEQIIADTLDSIPVDLRPTQIINAERAQKIVAAIRDSGYTVIALPEAKSPTPALIEAAYIAQDDLSKPPDRWTVEFTAEIIQAYIDGQGHEKVWVIGHDAQVAAQHAGDTQ
ncbi:hypothetical protein [Gordonia terrae]